MKEKLAKQPVKTHRYNGKTYLILDGVDQILTLIREEIERSLLTDEEIDKQYIDGWAKRNTETDSPLELKAIDGDDSIDVLRELAQVQLNKILKALEV